MAEVVLVTGANGCLGQHIVKLLQEKDESVREIRLFDLAAYQNTLGHATSKPMKSIVGDVSNLCDLIDAFNGVDCVIHTAAVVDVTMFPDEKLLYKTNVLGTKYVIEACLKRNVRRLLYTGTVDAYDGDSNNKGLKSTSEKIKNTYSGPYAVSKNEAEKLVLNANGSDELACLSLRLTPMYGEGDRRFLYYIIQTFNVGGVLACSIKLSDWRVPFWLYFIVLLFGYHFLRLVRIFYKVNCRGIPPRMALHYCNHTPINGKKTSDRIKYEPIYSYQDSLSNSIAYYSKQNF